MTCPRCRKRAEDAKHAEHLAAAEAYGKVPADEYERLRQAAAVPIVLDQTLRENWDIGLSDEGEFAVDYAASCTECGWNFTYEHQQGPEKVFS